MELIGLYVWRKIYRTNRPCLPYIIFCFPIMLQERVDVDETEMFLIILGGN